MRVAELMTTPVATLYWDDELRVADDLMELGRIRHLPVVDRKSDLLVGLLTQRDLFRCALAQTLRQGRRPGQSALANLRIREVMTRDLVTTEPAASLQVAAQTMLERKIGCLPVLTDGKLVGILTESDFVGLLANDCLSRDAEAADLGDDLHA